MNQQEPDVFTPFMRKVAALYRPFGLSEERLKQVADQIPMWALILGGVAFLALFVFLLVGAIPALRFEVLAFAVVSFWFSSVSFLAASLRRRLNRRLRGFKASYDKD